MAKFFVLVIVNHTTKEFNVRVEPERGTEPGSIHSLQAYIVAMSRQVTKMKAGLVKPHWMMPFWERVVMHPTECEQIVLASLEADSVKQARQYWRQHHRNLFVSFYSGLGYVSFYAHSQSAEQDED